jgi:hypothetical protein
MSGIVRTPEEIVALGGWTQCGCGIPNRARYRVELVVGREGERHLQRVVWFACADHLVRDQPDRMLHPSIKAQGFLVLNTRITDQRERNDRSGRPAAGEGHQAGDGGGEG